MHEDDKEAINMDPCCWTCSLQSTATSDTKLSLVEPFKSYAIFPLLLVPTFQDLSGLCL